MNFEGTWKIEGTDETLKIKDQFASDQYLFTYSDKNKADERVFIFLSTARFAVLAKSRIYGRADVYIIDKNSFMIEDHKFLRIIENE